ncbi:hypothetical protein [Flavobacterium suzhouense]|uniref:DUF2975 domain-containing protein n=1 Tax=Flavobacterium suzhouense TaxID=1529638 RepID=A0ABW5NTA1_9FLAO
MKHHLNIIILALRAVITFAAGMILYYIGYAYLFISNDETALIKDFFYDYFTPITSAVPDVNNKWFAIAFCVVYSALLVYAIVGVTRLCNCLISIRKGKMFYHTQGNEFRRAGSTFIIFAKSRYILFCTTAVLYFDVTIFFRQLPSFLLLYLLGKLILLLAHITEKGEFIQEENELTI